MENELVRYEEGRNPGQLIALALDRQADPAVLSKLMDLQERWEAQTARKAFMLAMSAFKQEAPAVLKKNDRVDFTSAKGRTAYNYANLGSIVQEITAVLGKYELSATWQTSQDEKGNITVTCNVTHSAGHRESVTLTGPPDDSGNKNRIQAIGSAVTYLQRYTLLAALGLATTDDDDAGTAGKKIGGSDKPPLKEPQKKQSDTKTEGEQSSTVILSDVTSKGGKKKDGTDYTIYSIVDSAGVKYGTFSDTFADLARSAKEEGSPVTITYTMGQYGPKITNLTVREKQAGEDD